MNEPLDNQSMAELLAQQTAALQAIATRPIKTSTTTYTSGTSVPRALQDMIKNRDRVRLASQELDQALQARETLPYTLASALAAVPQQQGYGSWVSDFARGLGGGGKMLTDAQMARAQMKRENEMDDLAMILAYDKAMGNIEDQTQRQYMGYIDAPYALGRSSGSGSGSQQQVEPRVYDITPTEMPEVKPVWGEIELRSEQLKDPDTQARTTGGLVAKFVAERTNPGAREAMVANQQAYTNNFTQDAITEIAQKMGGSRGIDTVPEINIKGGPELSGAGMGSKQFESAVKDQAWSAADQIVKANPKTTVSRAELANAFINNFNHSIRPDYRLVGQLPTNYKPNNAMAKQIAGAVSQGNPATSGYDYSKYGAKQDATGKWSFK